MLTTSEKVKVSTATDTDKMISTMSEHARRLLLSGESTSWLSQEDDLADPEDGQKLA